MVRRRPRRRRRWWRARRLGRRVRRVWGARRRSWRRQERRGASDEWGAVRVASCRELELHGPTSHRVCLHGIGRVQQLECGRRRRVACLLAVPRRNDPQRLLVLDGHLGAHLPRHEAHLRLKDGHLTPVSPVVVVLAARHNVRRPHCAVRWRRRRGRRRHSRDAVDGRGFGHAGPVGLSSLVGLAAFGRCGWLRQGHLVPDAAIVATEGCATSQLELQRTDGGALLHLAAVAIRHVRRCGRTRLRREGEGEHSADHPPTQRDVHLVRLAEALHENVRGAKRAVCQWRR
mmetsp:Transcript_40035/g.105254  ORF Transcript_40035/g.105254 Transcript_40035/m.105254 type:complete len:288 (+) Transcript_40035:2528-3391(+)